MSAGISPHLLIGYLRALGQYMPDEANVRLYSLVMLTSPMTAHVDQKTKRAFEKALLNNPDSNMIHTIGTWLAVAAIQSPSVAEQKNASDAGAAARLFIPGATYARSTSARSAGARKTLIRNTMVRTTAARTTTARKRGEYERSGYDDRGDYVRVCNVGVCNVRAAASSGEAVAES
ncbi:hypothetical protein P4S72_23565 [Vibrio sp. PP-XX7]